MNDLIVNIMALMLIAAVIWWFWYSTPPAKSVSKNQLVEIVVEDGVYSPARIEVIAGEAFSLRFIRKDATPCAEKVIFERLDKTLELPLNQPVEIELKLIEAGEYAFACDMKMYRGTVLVKPAKKSAETS
ncbi:MAG: cupredoxin domain-containing protein [Gammaproteobacteria bacterium]|nr:cupredoxin domain-containing protein [Gammaproteobacteria bacterium]